MRALCRERIARLLQVFLIVVDDVIAKPLHGDLSEVAVLAAARPGALRQRAQQLDRALTQLAERIECLVRVLPTVITFDRPESIVEARQVWLIFFEQPGETLEIDLLPIAQVRQDFDHPPAAIRRRPQQRVEIVRAGNGAAKLIRKRSQRGDDVLGRTYGIRHAHSAWFGSDAGQVCPPLGHARTVNRFLSPRRNALRRSIQERRVRLKCAQLEHFASGARNPANPRACHQKRSVTSGTSRGEPSPSERSQIRNSGSVPASDTIASQTPGKYASRRSLAEGVAGAAGWLCTIAPSRQPARSICTIASTTWRGSIVNRVADRSILSPGKNLTEWRVLPLSTVAS